MLKKLTEQNYNIHAGSSYSGIVLNVNLQKLLDIFGQPTFVGSGDNKTQLEWVFFEEEKCITVYDWKTNTPIHRINVWNVGGKNLTTDEIIDFLTLMGLRKNDEIIYTR